MRGRPEDYGLDRRKIKGSDVLSMPDKTSRRPQKRARKAQSPHARLLGAEAAKADEYIADQLKAMYDAVVVEPIPDRLMHLLDRLDNDGEE
jgi:Anti-sigma factor NepR